LKIEELPANARLGQRRTLDALVERVQAARVRALRSVNQELVLLYWHIGRPAITS